MSVSVTARSEDSAIDMELSVLSNVPEENEEEPQERDTLMGGGSSFENLKIEIPVPRELDMPHTPRMPQKTFADIKDPSPRQDGEFLATSTPAPQSAVKSKRRKDGRKAFETLENNPDVSVIKPDPENGLSDSSGDPCECDDDVAPKTRGQFMLFLAVIALSVLTGFLAGYFLREVKMKQEQAALLEGIGEEPCVVSRIPTALTVKQMRYHDRAMRITSQDHLMKYSSMFSASSCLSATPCSRNLTNNLVTMLKDLGHSNVDISTYNVLVSLPDLTQTSRLRTKDSEGNVLYTVHLYGEVEESISTGNSTKDTLSPDDINKRSITDNPSSVSQPPPMYVPYSASGTVEGDLIYVNCASSSDFATIDDVVGIDLVGRIAIARRCDMMTMEQVKNVQKEGMLGLILYSDPADVSPLPTMQSGMGISGMYGDPLSPGCPSMDGMAKKTIDPLTLDLPVIPVQTVTSDVAVRLLSNITGKEAPADWQGGLNTTYHIGRKNKVPLWTVELEVHNTMEQQDIHNIMVTIPGADYPDEYVLMGAHFTTTMMISADPAMSTATGSVSMAMETATVLADLMKEGWQPKRTVMLGLWEGAEMGHSGAMEWVEEHRKVLEDRSVAYIDLDTMMGSGAQIVAETSPVLMGVVMDAAEQLELSDVVMTTTLDGMGDHVPFSHMLGIPSVSFHTSPAMKDSSPVADLDVSTTMLATKTLLLLADDPMIRYDGFSLAEMVMTYTDNFETKMAAKMTENNITMDYLKIAANEYMQTVLTLQNMVDEQGMLGDPVTMTMINDRMMTMEKSFVMEGTMDTMRHILYGSQQMDTFSIMLDVMNDDDVAMDTVEDELILVQCILQSATTSLALTLT